MRKIFITISFAIATGFTGNLIAQDNTKIVNWYNKKAPGMSTEKAYKKVKGKKSTTVIVAVIDSGIDIEHEDLKGKIWTNTKEIPNNGIDDDKNGYVDDIHGWNYLGNRKGENLEHANLEKTRVLRDLSKKYDNVDGNTLSGKYREEYDLYKKVKEEVEQEIVKYTKSKSQYEKLHEKVKEAPSKVATILGKKDYTIKDLKKWNPSNEEDAALKNIAMALKAGVFSEERIKEGLEYFDSQINYYLNVNYIDRTLIGDNPEDFNDKNYGNSDVEGPDALHGTHVGGIIGAVRGNKLGGDGVCENVQLMSLRAVPDGDENDKDIALAIRYAVDNGARVINMSFGKAYSPHQKEVYDAFAYANSKGVLLIHAAGNDDKDLEVEPNFPTVMYSFQKERLNLLLNIGASTKNPKKQLAADFSNYGRKSVDVFAPGHEIYNTIPQSSYKTLQGTSMAAPMVAGAAAFLASYFPTMTMAEIKDVLLKSAKSYKGTQQYKPGTEELVDFATLSVTGAVIDLQNAVKMCLEKEMSKTK